MQLRVTKAVSGCFAWKDVWPLLTMGLFVFLVSVTHSESIFAYASTNRQHIAMVAFVEEADILSVLSSVKHLHPQLVHRYEHDWIFVSHKPVSQNFLSLTSSATGSLCKQEQLSDSHQKIELIRLEKGNSWSNERQQPVAMMIVNQSHPKFSGVHGEYDLYVLLEPKNKAIRGVYREQHAMPIYLMTCSSLSSHLGLSEKHQIEAPVRNHDPAILPRVFKSNRVSSSYERNGYLSHPVENLATQEPASESMLADMTQILNATKRSSGIRSRLKQWLRSSAGPAIFSEEKRNLFRQLGDAHNGRLMDRPHITDGYLNRNKEIMNGPTISQQLMQPRTSVWSRLRKRDFRYVTKPSPAEPTAGIKTNVHYSLLAIGKHDMKVRLISDRGDGAMMEQYEFWELVAADFNRQDGIPGLQSGNTVIDERNFEML